MRRDVHNDLPGSVEHFQRSKIFVHQGEFAAGPKSYVFHDDTRPYIRKDTDVWLRQKLDW